VPPAASPEAGEGALAEAAPPVAEEGVATALGGIWYLINLLLALGLLDPEQPKGDPWEMLRALAAGLLSGEPADPVWEILDRLGAGNGAGAAVPRPPPTLVADSQTWLAEAGFCGMEVPGLLTQPARLYVTRTHVDLQFRLDQIDVGIRRAGLDRDPGWVAVLGRVVSFHYE
jgi:hypothetical protein